MSDQPGGEEGGVAAIRDAIDGAEPIGEDGDPRGAPDDRELDDRAGTAADEAEGKGAGKGKGGPRPGDVADGYLRGDEDEGAEPVHMVTDDADLVYRWNGRHYELLSPAALRALALACDGRSSSGHRRNEIVSHWKARTHRAGLTWGRVKPHEIAVDNGVVDLRTLRCREHSPDDYLEWTVPHRFNRSAQCPVWLDALDTWFGSADGDDAKALQQFFGYCLMPHARYKRALFLYGRPDAGKSVPLHVIERLVGADRRCSIPVSAMDDPRRVALIKGKAVNIVTELPDDALVADGGFKTLVSTEEPILLDHKYGAIETYVPKAKHIIAMNSLPRVMDQSEATFNRLLILHFDRPIPVEEQDKDLPAKLSAEIEGILAWAIEGARSLFEAAGEFTVSTRSRETMDEYRYQENPVLSFIAEQCEPDPVGAVPAVDFAAAFNEWQGGRVWDVRRVSKAINASSDYDVRPVKIDGRPVRCVRGLKLAIRKDGTRVVLDAPVGAETF